MTNKELNEQREQHDARINDAESRMKSGMTNAQCIDRWADSIIPAVFKAEDALQKAKPEWKEKLANVSKENGALLARLYCEEIATIIVKMGSDYEPDGSIDGEMDYIENT